MRDNLLLVGLLAAVTHFAACEGMDPVAPSDGGSEVGAAAAPVIVTTVAIGEWPGSNSGISGEAILTRTKDGLSVDQDVEGLISGHAYSVWWAIFDNPQGCVDACDPSDLGVRQAQGSLINGGGFVAAGTTQFYTSDLARHDVEGRQVWVGDLSGVDNTYGAEVHVVLRGHGPAVMDPADQAVQTSTFNGFCNPVCANVSVAPFSAPEAPGQGS
ncbi:MAG TPA: hypothetical protein VJP59_10500 [Gemmatimonadota bacterium]|nr:hypothetical protein [Gemmatimonadota bacterium]